MAIWPSFLYKYADENIGWLFLSVMIATEEKFLYNVYDIFIYVATKNE